MVSIERRYVPHSRNYTRCFTPCFWRSDYQPQRWYRLATSELRYDIWFEWNYYPLLTGRIVHSNIKKKWENIHYFFKVFSKKRSYLADPVHHWRVVMSNDVCVWILSLCNDIPSFLRRRFWNFLLLRNCWSLIWSAEKRCCIDPVSFSSW